MVGITGDIFSLMMKETHSHCMCHSMTVTAPSLTTLAALLGEYPL
jgi:hypothetical protein